jgi:hypothetical protein
MEKNILSEIDQMKYLFGYKPGKVISEQATPPVQTGAAKTAPAKGVATKTPQKGQRPNAPVAKKLNQKDLILKEMLENLSNGTMVYASKIVPTNIYIISPNGLKEYNGVVSSVDVKSTIDFYYFTLLDNMRQKGIGQGRMALSTRTIEESLAALNNNINVVAIGDDFGFLEQYGEDLSDTFMYLTGQGERDFEKTIDMLKTAQPNIVPKLVQSLGNKVKTERDRERSDKISSVLQKVIQITGQQYQQLQQPQQK